ncbi:ATP-binding protein [Plesiomonas shigelloides]|uniref:ATP-binding protein n=1 Tax=Plesiomonas shigelloides TaxID=703 RepID=UPI0012615656|nr:ATP-binding protein [Plesiomonas shigelloides]KAB7684443.1 ATP-binding protein [Plesiomonas shigelloides]
MLHIKRRVFKLELRCKRSKLKRKVSNTIKSAGWEAVERAKLNLANVKKKTKNKNKSFVFVVKNRRVRFYSPRHINYYNKSDYEKTNRFINELRDCVMKGCRAYIDFSNTEKISAAAMISFLAEVDILIKKSCHGVRAIGFSNPKNKKIESILNQVGFYDLLKKDKRETEIYDDVTFWKYTSGACSEPLLAKSMIIDIKKELEQKSSKRLYRGFIEAMSNSVEHAYLDCDKCTESDGTAKWWTFAGIYDKKLIIVICDKGVGIPATLPKTQGAKLLIRILKSLGVSCVNVKDSMYIKTSTILRETRTGKTNRGKGLHDIKSVIDLVGDGYMGIFSNKGRYIYKGKAANVSEVLTDYKSSVNGTIIEWAIPCEVE